MSLISLWQIQNGPEISSLIKNGLPRVAPQVDKIKVTAPSNAPVTEFTTTQTPNAQLVNVRINNIVYIENEEFTVDRAQKKVTWNFTKAKQGFDIDSELADHVDIIYYVDAPVKQIKVVPDFGGR